MLPLFPLNLVVFPQEKLNLHVFEPRYRQLIHDCLAEDGTFGIPAFLNNRIEDYGTEVRIVSIEKAYEDGRLDVSTEGGRPFRLFKFDNPAPGKLYAGGVVEFLELRDRKAPAALTADLLNLLTELYTLMQLKLDIGLNKVKYISFEVAHKIGLSVEQELELLTLLTEDERQQFILDHLKRVIPVVTDLEKTKERIKMNGHFKTFDPLSF